MKNIEINNVNYYAGKAVDANGFPARWASIHVCVMWDGERYVVKTESYLGTGSASNKYESETTYNDVEDVNNELHITKEYADYYQQKYKD